MIHIMTSTDKDELHKELLEAQKDIETIDTGLVSKKPADQYKALALLFMVRDTVVDILIEVFPKGNLSAQELLSSTMEEDPI